VSSKNIDDFKIDIKQLASNTNLIKANKLTLTALLLFGKQPQKHRPLFTIQCVAFSGNSINSTVKLFIFQDRIEIISPGVLPNSLTVENIKSGISIPRNPTLQSIAQFILPYSGLGTGITRITELYPDIEFENNISKEQFITIIKRVR